MFKPFAMFAAATLAFALTSASAQEERIWRPPGGGQAQADISLYRAPNYQGPHIRAQTAVSDLGVNWRVRSVRVTRGEWQICSGVNYTGFCRTIDEDIPVIAALSDNSRIRSLRPAPREPSGGGNAGPSLRGMSSEFFTQPSSRGQRILACQRGQASMNCARQTAEQFCRARGYNYLGNVALQTERNRVYLADVLCKRSAS